MGPLVTVVIINNRESVVIKFLIVVILNFYGVEIKDSAEKVLG